MLEDKSLHSHFWMLFMNLMCLNLAKPFFLSVKYCLVLQPPMAVNSQNYVYIQHFICLKLNY